MRRLSIIGLGLMGGSLGLAAKARGLPWHVAGYTRTPARGRLALKRGAVDSLHRTPAEAVREADVVVYCAPILSLPALVRESRSGLKPGALVTDVGSTKVFLDTELPALLKDSGALFVGSHPLAGSEQQGIEAAHADLYEGAVVVVTPTRDTPLKAVKAARTFWRKLGAVVYEMDAREHDRVMARTSHLPHMVASLLAVTAARTGRPEQLAPFCGTGFADTSRVAAGSPEVWHDIVRTNRGNVAEELRAYKVQVDRLIGLLDQGDFEGIQHFLENGRAARQSLLKGRGKGRE